MIKTLLKVFSLITILALVLMALPAQPVKANNTAQTIPFSQDWSNTGLITVDDNWSGVPGIIGYRGDGLTGSTGVDPQTVVADGTAVIDVIANQANPNTLITGGVAEFHIANPVVALQGSGTARAPFILLHLITTGQSNITVAYNLRDIDGSADNAIQQVALQFRVGSSGNFTNVPAGYVADATTGGTATQVTPISAVLPAAANNQPLVQIRVITTDAAGSDEWVGIDDISVTTTETPPTVVSTIPANGAANATVDANITINFNEAVNVAGTWFTISCASSGSHTAVVSGGPSTFTLDPDINFSNNESCTVTVLAGQVTDQDANDPPDNMTADYVGSFTTLPLPGSIVVSQVYGGGGNVDAPFKNDYVELYNRSASTVNVTGWTVQYASASGSSWSATALSGSIPPGKHYLVREAAGNSCSGSPCGVDLPAPDATGTITMSSTDGKVALVNNSALLSGTCPTGSSISDFVGYGSANCYEGLGAAPGPSNTTAALRLNDGEQDTDDNSADFEEGDPNPRNSHDIAPAVSSTVPANGAIGVAVAANITINFSEPVDVTGSWFTISCASSGGHSATTSGGPTSFTLDLDADFNYLESCAVTILASQVTDQDTDDLPDNPDNMAADYFFSFTTIELLDCEDPATFIHDIQGTGTTSPMIGTPNVVIQGVVVGDYQNTATEFSGFHVQEEDADADAGANALLTSEGIFVFDNGFGVDVLPGDVVRVKGTVSEFANLTEMSNVSVVQVCGSGSSSSVTAASVELPVDALSDWEAYESMLVSISEELTVTETFTLARYGEVSLSAGGRLFTPTNVVEPGTDAQDLQDLNNRSRIVLDDANSQQNIDPTRYPTGGLSASNTLRSGYTVTGLTGVLEERFGVYRIQPVGAISFDDDNPRPEEPEDTEGTLTIVGMNLLNFFNTFSGCTGGAGGAATDCRGANSPAEFERQWPKTVAAIHAMNPDVLGVNELENDGYGPTSAIQFLVDKLNAEAAPGDTYAFIDVDANTDQVNAMGTDAIRVAFLYKPSKVTPYGQTAALNSVAFVNGGDPAPRSRPSLAQAFKQNSNNEIFIVDLNHLKSKGSPCTAADAGDGQGNCNQVRVNAVTELMNWLAGDPTEADDPDVLLIGDYNSYAMEDPIDVIKSAGYTDLIQTLIGDDAYSYVFDGQSGYLDHALASEHLVSQVAGVSEYHINADEPVALDYNLEFKNANQQNIFYDDDQFRVSDHDPVIVGLSLNSPPTVDAGGPYAVSEGGSVGVSAVGDDPNPGDVATLTYAWDLDNNGSFETPGQNVNFSAAGLDGPSSHTINVQVTDSGGLFAVDEAIVNVSNEAPSVNTPVVVPEPSIKGNSTIAGATFTDPAPNDAPFICTVNYGDGSGELSGTVISNTCTGPSHTYTNVGSYTVTVTITDKDTGTGSNSTTHVVIYNFNGFFQPVDNLPTFNVVKAGSGIPVKFNLTGNQGLNIFASGYPKSEVIACNSTDPVDGIEETVTAGGSSLSYDPITGTYTYIWKTEKAWANTCRQLVVKLNDGTFHRANFNFTK